MHAQMYPAAMLWMHLNYRLESCMKLATTSHEISLSLFLMNSIPANGDSTKFT